MNDRRRVTLLGPWPPPYGGVAVHVQRLRQLLADAGFDPKVLTFADRASSAHVKHFRVGRSYWPKHLWTLARTVGRGGILHNHYSSLTMFPLAREDPETRRATASMLRFSEMWQIKWVETVHDQTIIERLPRSSLETRELFLKALSIATKVIATSESLREFLVEAGVGQSKIVVGRPLLPGRGVEEPLAQRYQSFFAEHAPVWITIGAFIPLYDFVTVAAAFRRLLETQPNAGLVVVSGSFSIDETYRRRVLSLVSPVSQNVVFLEDVANEDVIALLRASNVLIRGPERESFGLSRAEAILVGTPVVATETGESAFTTPYKFGDADSILEATELVATLEPETMRDGRSHYQRIESDDLTVILDVYRELAAIGHLPSSMK